MRGAPRSPAPATEPGASREPGRLEQRRFPGPSVGRTVFGEREHETSLVVFVFLILNFHLIIYFYLKGSWWQGEIVWLKRNRRSALVPRPVSLRPKTTVPPKQPANTPRPRGAKARCTPRPRRLRAPAAPRVPAPFSPCPRPARQRLEMGRSGRPRSCNYSVHRKRVLRNFSLLFLLIFAWGKKVKGFQCPTL